MPRNPPNPELVKLVLESADAGMSHEDIAELAGIAASTVLMWRKKYGGYVPRKEPPLVAQAEIERRAALPPPEDAPPTDAPSDVRSIAQSAVIEAREAIATIKGIIAEAKKMGNTTAAQRAARDLGAAITTLGRLERHLSTDGEIRVSPEDIAIGREAVRARAAAVLAAPLTCAHCGRQLRIDWTKEGQGK